MFGLETRSGSRHFFWIRIRILARLLLSDPGFFKKFKKIETFTESKKHEPSYFFLTWGPCWLAWIDWHSWIPVHSGSETPVWTMRTENTWRLALKVFYIYIFYCTLKELFGLKVKWLGNTSEIFISLSLSKALLEVWIYIDPKASRVVIEFLPLVFLRLLMFSITSIQRYTEITHDLLSF